MQRRLEAVLLALRWTMLPLYLALLTTVAAIYVLVGREVIHLFAVIMTASETEIVLLVLGLLDLVLVAHLVLMVAVSSYESTISPIAAAGDKPDWMGKTSSGDIKVKLSIAIVMISAIHLLRAFMMDATTQQLLGLGAVHLVFVVSTVAMGIANSRKPQ